MKHTKTISSAHGNETVHALDEEHDKLLCNVSSNKGTITKEPITCKKCLSILEKKK